MLWPSPSVQEPGSDRGSDDDADDHSRGVALPCRHEQAAGDVARVSTVPNDENHPLLPAAVARELLLGRRESLTIASELGVPVVAVNDALVQLRDLCDGCIALRQPYAGEPRFIVVVDNWEP